VFCCGPNFDEKELATFIGVSKPDKGGRQYRFTNVVGTPWEDLGGSCTSCHRKLI